MIDQSEARKGVTSFLSEICENWQKVVLFTTSVSSYDKARNRVDPVYSSTGGFTIQHLETYLLVDYYTTYT